MKIFIIGLPGSGKTTYARQLAKETGLPLLELDSLFLEAANGRGRRRFLEEVEDELNGWLAQVDWIIEGVYPIELIMQQADRIVYVDAPLRSCLARIWRRTIQDLSRRAKYGLRSELALSCSLLAWKSRLVGVKVYRRQRIKIPTVGQLTLRYGPKVTMQRNIDIR